MNNRLPRQRTKVRMKEIGRHSDPYKYDFGQSLIYCHIFGIVHLKGEYDAFLAILETKQVSI